MSKWSEWLSAIAAVMSVLGTMFSGLLAYQFNLGGWHEFKGKVEAQLIEISDKIEKHDTKIDRLFEERVQVSVKLESLEDIKASIQELRNDVRELRRQYPQMEKEISMIREIIVELARITNQLSEVSQRLEELERQINENR